MTDDLRALAEVFSENGCAMTSDVERLAKGYLVLLSSLEAAERERDAALDRLAERTADWNIALGRAEQAEAALKVAVRALERCESVLSLIYHRGFGHGLGQPGKEYVGVRLHIVRDALRTLEGREEKPSGESSG